MNRQVCKYSIIRFQPFPETEEFANIGVVLFATASKRLEFKLLDSRHHKRITDFFDHPLVKDSFSQTIKMIDVEIERIKNNFDEILGANFDRYADLIRSREDIVRFSDSRVLFSNDPAITVNQLFDHYVNRSFVRAPSYEEKMRKQVRNLLVNHNLGDLYKEAVVGDIHKYKATFPFVHKGEQQKVIKPIQFLHNEPTALIDHGREWLTKVEYLKKYNFIQPEQVLFAYTAKKPSEQSLFDPFDEVMDLASKLGVAMVDLSASGDIVRFASA
jgi:hypothetical protein